MVGTQEIGAIRWNLSRLWGNAWFLSIILSLVKAAHPLAVDRFINVSIYSATCVPGPSWVVWVDIRAPLKLHTHFGAPLWLTLVGVLAWLSGFLGLGRWESGVKWDLTQSYSSGRRSRVAGRLRLELRAWNAADR